MLHLLLRPHQTPSGAYILHPDFVMGMIKQLMLQHFDRAAGEVDWVEVNNDYRELSRLFSQMAVDEVLENGGTKDEAQRQANEVVESIAAGAMLVQ